MFNKVFIWGIASLMIVLAAGYYFFVVKNNTAGQQLELVPADAAIVIQVDEPERLLRKFNPDHEIWKSLAKSEPINRSLSQITAFDSIIQSDQKLASIFSGSLIVSLHYDPRTQQAQPLFLIDAEHKPAEDFSQILGQHFEDSLLGQQKKILSITNEQFNIRVFAATKGNNIVISPEQSLVERVLESAPGGDTHFSKSIAFVKLSNAAGKNTDAIIYFRYAFLSPLINQYLRNPANDINPLAEWTETDLLIKRDELLFSGFTVASVGDVLGNYSGQQPAAVKSYNIAPNNTCLLYSTNAGKPIKTGMPDKLSTLNKSVNFNLEMLLETFDSELSLIGNATDEQQIENNTWAIVRTNNRVRSLQYLNQISSNTGVQNGYSIGQFTVREINTRNLVPGIFGKSFAMIDKTWFTIIGDFVVFGNSYVSLSQLIRYYETGKTLDLNENFKSFSDNIAGRSNMLLYISPSHISAYLQYYLNDDALKSMQTLQPVLEDFQGLAVQFTAQDSMFYTNFYTRNNKTMAKENFDAWRVELDYEITGTPYLVRDHTDNTYNIIVFDKEANIYLITADGRVAWNKKLDNIPLSGIRQIDFYKNGKIQYLFNTRDFIYLLDKNGENVSSFPQKINPSATNGLSLFDYNQNNDYRLVMAQADKRVYNYEQSGKKVSGWNRPKTDDIVAEPIVHMAAGGLDYILITDIGNNLQIVDRRGRQRIKLKEEPRKARNSTYYVNQTNNKGVILTTNQSGKLTYISRSGRLQHTDFGDYGAGHFFLYEDFTGNGYRDFIYIEGDKLKVFDRFKKVVFTYRFPASISIKPVFFTLGKKQNVLGIVDSKNKTIYLFDKHGNPVISSGLVGENPFTVGSLQNDDEINLITSVGRTLYNYRIK